MTARVWLPVQQQLAQSWPAALALLVISLFAVDVMQFHWRFFAFGVYVIVPAIAVLRRGRDEGIYVVSQVTGVLWASIFLAVMVGGVDVARTFLTFGVAATLGSIPLALQFRPRVIDRLRRLEDADLAPVFAGGVVVFSAMTAVLALFGAFGPVDTELQELRWLSGVTLSVAFLILTQRPVRTLVFAAGLFTLWRVWPSDLYTATLTPFVTVWVAAYADGLDGRPATLRRVVELIVMWCASSAFLVFTMPSLISGLVWTGAMLIVVFVARGADTKVPLGGADTSLEHARRALSRLPPFFRWYGTAKLNKDPLYGRLAEMQNQRAMGHVLDIGAGTGLAAGIVATCRTTESLTMIDLDTEKLRAAESLVTQLNPSLDAVTFVGTFPAASLVPLFENRPSDMQRFDTVLLFDVLHYASKAEQLSMLIAAKNLLAPNGMILLRDPVAEDGEAGKVQETENWTTLFGINPPGETEYLSGVEWSGWFAAAGLQMVHSEPCGDENVLMVLARA